MNFLNSILVYFWDMMNIMNKANYKNTNIFSVLSEYNEYEDFEDIAPYNKLKDGRKWTDLWMNRHPLCNKIKYRFSQDYNGKRLWIELNEMKENIVKMKKAMREYQEEVWTRRRELRSLIKEQEKLCSEEQTCAQKLQKHLNECIGFDGTGKHKCTEYFICYGCKFRENGRCSHYYEIERANEELESEEYYNCEDKNKITFLEYEYIKALAVKEDRLEEFEHDMFEM